MVAQSPRLSVGQGDKQRPQAGQVKHPVVAAHLGALKCT